MNAIQYVRHNLTNVERKVAAITEDKSARSESGQRSDLRTKPVFEGRLKLLDERLKKPKSTSASWLVAVVAASARYVPAGHATHVLDAVAAVAVL